MDAKRLQGKALRDWLNSEEIPPRWLRYATTPEKVERSRLERMAAGFNLPLDKVVAKFAARPFGAVTERWREFVKKLGENDELWYFNSDGDSWAKKLGCAGYAIVRNGAIREKLVILEN